MQTLCAFFKFDDRGHINKCIQGYYDGDANTIGYNQGDALPSF